MKKLIVILVASLTSVACLHAQSIWDLSHLASVKESLDKPVYATACRQLLDEADRLMTKEPVSVMLKEFTPASGDKHDYMSLARYYWPDTTKADGRIMKTSAPAVLDSAFRRDATYGAAISLGNVDMQKEAADNYNAVIEKYCKAVYEITAASMIHAKAQMAMWFTDMDGNLILPGNTCRFVSEGKDIYYGYARQIVHYMSKSGGCSTTVAMSYVRPEASFKIGGAVAIAAGSKNAAYE